MPLSIVRHTRPLLLCAALLQLGAFIWPPASAAGGAEQANWEGKLGPFLKRVVGGTTREQGRFRVVLPARSEQVLRSLPPFVRIDRLSSEPTLFVKAWIDSDWCDGDPEVESMDGLFGRVGVEVRGRVGSIAALSVPAASLEAIASSPYVRWMKAARRFRLMNEISTGADHVASDDANATFSNEGAGVIIATVDTGIDWPHDDFRNADGTTRILAIWDQTITDPGHPPPPGFSFGAYYTRSDIDAALLPGGDPLMTVDEHGHGTHVAGSAAGNGRRTGNGVPEGTFAGVAPLADIVAVKVFVGQLGSFCDECDLTAAVQFIHQIAAAAGKPWVGNMSLGDYLGGAHDGTAPEELAIDAVVGPGRPGAQMAIAAGNEGSDSRRSHWEGVLVQGQTLNNTFALSGTSPDGFDNDFVWFDLWYEGEDQATVEIVPPGGYTVSAAHGVDSGIICTPSGAVHIDATNAPDAANGDNQVFIEIFDSGSCVEPAELAGGTWTVRIIGDAIVSGGSFDIWNEADTLGAGWVNLSTYNLESSVTVPGTSRNALTAGSYVHKSSWTNGSGGTSSPSTSAAVGERSSFSGRGPTRDGRTKPEIAAPGEWVGSTISEGDLSPPHDFWQERDGEHHNLRGTSMATPHVAGAAALLLGINPQLDGAAVKAALLGTALADAFTGAVPNEEYGHGKLNVYLAAHAGAAQITDLGADSPTSFSGTGHAVMTSFNVYRGGIPGISATDYGSCFLTGLTAPDFDDTATPDLGEALFYLVTSVYLDPITGTTPIEGSLGTDSGGAVRPNNSPCP